MSIRSLSRFIRAALSRTRSTRHPAVPHRPRAIAGAMFALLLPLGASATVEQRPGGTIPLGARLAPPSPTLCNNEPMPVLEAPYSMRCATDFSGIYPNLPDDQGNAIRAALASLVSDEAGLFFPQGTYLVGGQLTLRTGNVLVGSPSGFTHFINPAQETSLITQDLGHSAHKILVEGLVLDNIAVQFFHGGGSTGIGSVLRYTGFRQTASPAAQIALLSGANQVLGNVLWREPGHPGLGIQARGAKGSRIAGNLLGTPKLADLPPRRDVDAARVRRLARAMSTLAGRDGTVPNAADGKGNFSVALQAIGTSSTTIDGNEVLLNPAPVGAANADRTMAQLLRTTRLGMKWNRFAIAGNAPTQAPSITFSAPQSLVFSMNRLDRVPLHIVPDDSRPTKNSSIRSNWFIESVGDTTQGVTGDDVTDTTISDLRFVDNSFNNRDLSACMLSAPVPTAPGRTFAAEDNVMLSGVPAKLCNLRPEGR
jgi:hypothetical protein